MERALKPDAIERGLVRLQEVVRDRGLKHSRVRDDIARAALAYRGHFDVEDLVHALNAAGMTSIHAATVYRTLPLLLETELVEAAPGSKGESQRYEAIFEREHHDHLVCTGCGKIVEFRSPTLESLQHELAERYGYALEDHVHELRGRCRDCRKR